jgi:beta-lactamase regulating signal transducer with metallopeptidase domain
MNPLALAAPDWATLIHMLGWTLLHFLWQGCAIAAALALALMVMRHATASQRYLAGCLALSLMAAAPPATLAWLWPRSEVIGSFAGSSAVSVNNTVTPAAEEIDRPMLAIVAAWLIGVCVCGVWVAGGWWQTRRLRRLDEAVSSWRVCSSARVLARRMGCYAAVRVVDSAAVLAPMTIGVIRPVILIPAATLIRISPAHLEAIIAHELAHVRRLDALVNLLQALLEALLFYHPAVWWVSRVVRQEREYCCDDIAAEVCGDSMTYARALAELEALRSVSLRLGLSSQGGSLMKRIVRLVGERADRSQASLRSRMTGLMAVMTMVGITTAAFALAEAPRNQTPPATEEVSPCTGEVLLRDAVVLDYVVALEGMCEQEAAGQWLAIEPVHELGQPALTQWLLAAEALHSAKDLAVAEPPVDPAHMPSDGLLRAAQYAYPFNLFELTPWVDPRVRDLLVERPQPAMLRLEFARALVQRQGGFKIDVVPQIVHLRGNVRLEATVRGDDHATITADHMTVDLAPLQHAEGVWLATHELAEQAPPPAESSFRLRWIHAVHGHTSASTETEPPVAEADTAPQPGPIESPAPAPTPEPKP